MPLTVPVKVGLLIGAFASSAFCVKLDICLLASDVLRIDVAKTDHCPSDAVDGARESWVAERSLCVVSMCELR